jgi:DUF4097 and DUF4098 domain-containing protein YvlB
MNRKLNCGLGLVACALPLLAAARDDSDINRRVAASATGEVVVSNVSGSIELIGWERNEVEVRGSLGSGVERVEVQSSDGRTTIKVILPHGSTNHGSADLEIHVPRGSSLDVNAVSADIESASVLGAQRLKTVSGNITAQLTGGNSEMRTVSGDLTLRADGKPGSLRVASVSGNVDLTGAAGKLDLVTVSGESRVDMSEATEIRGRTTSGDLNIRARLARDGRVDAESVSGGVRLRVAPVEGLSLEIESFSGDIHGCLAKNVERVSRYGPGLRMSVRNVEAGGTTVRAKTLSGDVDICDR